MVCQRYNDRVWFPGTEQISPHISSISIWRWKNLPQTEKILRTVSVLRIWRLVLLTWHVLFTVVVHCSLIHHLFGDVSRVCEMAEISGWSNGLFTCQERKRFEGHLPSPHDDLTFARENLEKHMDWVLHGDQKAKVVEENTYPLPHNAYSQRPLANHQLPPQKDDNQLDMGGSVKTARNDSSNICTTDVNNSLESHASQHLTQTDTKNANTKVSITESEINAFFNKQ